VPHLANEDDVFEGYHIPKGAIVIGNVWWVHCVLRRLLFIKELYVCMLHRAILHDEGNYPEPFKFNPDRFLTEDGQLNPAVQDPALAAFGFGRRFAHRLFSSLLYFALLTNTYLTHHQNLRRKSHRYFISMAHYCHCTVYVRDLARRR